MSLIESFAIAALGAGVLAVLVLFWRETLIYLLVGLIALFFWCIAAVSFFVDRGHGKRSGRLNTARQRTRPF